MSYHTIPCFILPYNSFLLYDTISLPWLTYDTIIYLTMKHVTLLLESFSCHTSSYYDIPYLAHNWVILKYAMPYRKIPFLTLHWTTLYLIFYTIPHITIESLSLPCFVLSCVPYLIPKIILPYGHALPMMLLWAGCCIRGSSWGEVIARSRGRCECDLRRRSRPEEEEVKVNRGRRSA